MGSKQQLLQLGGRVFDMSPSKHLMASRIGCAAGAMRETRKLVTTASMHLVKPLHWILAKSYAFERSTARASNIEVGVRFGHGRRE